MELTEINDDIEAFLIESYENLNQIEQDIISIEKVSEQGEALVRIYRSLHTIKGNCGFLPFPKLESLAHAGENLLSSLRDRQLAITPTVINTLLQILDSIRQILSEIEATRHEGDRDYSALITSLAQLQLPEQTTIASVVNPQESQVNPDTKHLNHELPEVSTLTASESSQIRVNVNLLDQVMNLMGELVLTRNQVMGFSSKFKDSTFAATCQHLSLLTSQLQQEIMKTRLQSIGTIWQKFPRVIRDLAIASGKEVKVDMEGIDTELDKSIIEAIKDPLTHLVRNCIDHGIELPAERTACGKPSVGRLFLRAFHESGKVNIEIGDDGRGLDVEKLKKRALQLGLVNAVEVASMSDAEAIDLIFLTGFSSSEQVTNLSGRGVGMDIVKSNIDKINGAIEIYSQPAQGTTFKIKIPLTLAIIPALIITSGGDRYAIPQASIQELVRLEAQAVNEIEKEEKGQRAGSKGDSIEPSSELQMGDSTRPVACVPAGVGESGGNDPCSFSPCPLPLVEVFYDVPVYRLRDTLVPLVYLNQVLQIPNSFTNLEMFSLVIVQVDNYQFGLVVDTIEDIQDIMVKPLGKQLKTQSLFAGATILGDGTVTLIIDVVGLANRSGVTAKQKQQLLVENAKKDQDQVMDRQTILLFEGPAGARMGIPLTIAFRLEEILCSAVEKVGNQDVVQSYGKILPLIDLHQIFSPGDENDLRDRLQTNLTETLQIVIVSPSAELSLALVVDRILDIVEEPLIITGVSNRPGVLFCAVFQGKITEILDIEAVIRIANPHLLQLMTNG